MSFQQGLSGLNASAKNLDVIGNNIANSATIGFKASQAQFADVYATSLSGTTSLSPGVGVKLTAVAQQFTQGNLSVTNNPLDIAINGNGFFLMQAPDGTLAYTRNGQFQMDADGRVVNGTGHQLMGYGIDPTTSVLSNTLGPIQILPNGTAKVTSQANLTMNLDAQSTAVTGPINPSDATTYNFTTAFTVYDSQGVGHTAALYFRKTATVNEWAVAGQLDGTQGIDLGGGAGSEVTITFDANGNLTTAMPLNLSVALPPSSGAQSPLAFTLDLTGTTQLGSESGVNSVTQNGRSAGKFVGLQINDYGLIQGRYDNGQTLDMGQIILYTFNNPNGLLPIGNNLWLSTSASGTPTPNTPGSGVAGVVRSGALEESNVDLTAELVNLIVAQRTYQANAQTIRAQDQILQTLVNLR